MGSIFSKVQVQEQYNFCEICNDNNITFESVQLIPNRFWCQGSAYFTCKNKYSFSMNILEFGEWSKATELAYQRFKGVNAKKRCNIIYRTRH